MVDLWGRRWTKDELLGRVGQLEQVAGVQLVEAGDWFRGFPGGLVSTCGQRRYQLEIGALLGRDAIDAFGARTVALTTAALNGGRT